MNKCLKPIWLMSQLSTQIESETQLNQTCYVKGMAASLQATDQGFTAKNFRPFFFSQTILMLSIRVAVNSQGVDIKYLSALVLSPNSHPGCWLRSSQEAEWLVHTIQLVCEEPTLVIQTESRRG